MFREWRFQTVASKATKGEGGQEVMAEYYPTDAEKSTMEGRAGYSAAVGALDSQGKNPHRK